MRLPFFDPRRDEITATATDLIKRLAFARMLKPDIWLTFPCKCVLADTDCSMSWWPAR